MSPAVAISVLARLLSTASKRWLSCAVHAKEQPRSVGGAWILLLIHTLVLECFPRAKIQCGVKVRRWVQQDEVQELMSNQTALGG